MSLIEKRRHNAIKELLDETGLYHSFQLPDGRMLRGAMGMDLLQARLAAFHLPDDLRGKTVLDIGPWDGFYTFEMERRGATVTAIDYVDLDTFRELHRAFQSNARYLRMDVYELDPERVGTFDIVLCLGALYHFKHPLLALEKICAVTRDVCIVDTFVVDGVERLKGIVPPMPYLEFYERAELGGQLDNWCGPTVCAVEAMVRAAGFAQPEVTRIADGSACVVAYRKWRDLPPEEQPAVEIFALTNHANPGKSFQLSKEEYLLIWCAWAGQEVPAFEDVFPEIDGLGAPPVWCARVIEGLHVTVRIPPGLAAGRHEVRIKIGRSRWSEAREFFCDLPPVSIAIEIISIQDGVTWKTGEVDWEKGGWVTVWVKGQTPEADAGNTVVEIGGVPHWPDAVDVNGGQVNVRLRPVVRAGTHEVVVVHRGARTRGAMVQVTGDAPRIKGLETLSEGTASKGVV